MPEKQYCPTCGQSTMVHKFILNKAHAEMLIYTAKRVRSFAPFHIKDQTATRDQYTNFCHLAYWGFIEKTEVSGKKKHGWWKLTPSAKRFLAGEQFPKWLKRFNKRNVETSTETVRITDCVGYFDDRDVWADRAEPLFDDGEGDLFDGLD